MKKLHFNLGALLSLMVLILGLFIFIGSLRMNYWSGYGPGEGFVSVWSSGFLILFSVASAISLAKEPGVAFKDVFPKGKKERKNILVAGIGLILFLLIVKFLGFFAGSVVLMILLFSRGFSWKKAILLGVLVSVICYVVFGILLDVPLPTGYLDF